MSRIIQVGFSQRILLDWLDRTMELSLTGKTKEEIIAELQELLCSRLSVGGTAERGNREKAITILRRKVNGFGGVIVLNNMGEVGISFNTPRMARAYLTSDMNKPVVEV